MLGFHGENSPNVLDAKRTNYQFLCALPPDSRGVWALRMSQLLAAEGSLVCIEFPSAKDPSLGGPPFALPPAVYVEHLAHPGKEIPYDDAGRVIGQELPIDPLGLRRMVHYHPQRTHEIGNGTDFVSIWRHQSRS